MKKHCLTVGILACFVAACGSDKASSTTGEATSPTPVATAATQTAQPAQASSDAADAAGAGDAQTAQGSTTSASKAALGGSRLLVVADHALESAQMAVSSQVATRVSGEFDYQGCKAHLVGAIDTGSQLRFPGRASFDANAQIAVRGNVVVDPNSCDRGRKVRGNQEVHAIFEDGNRVVQVTGTLVMTLRDGDTMTISSFDPNLPTYTLQAARLAGQGNVELQATINEHRKRVAADGNVVFDMTVQVGADAPLDIINAYEQAASDSQSYAVKTRTVVSGTSKVTRNITGAVHRHTFHNLKRVTETCSCPTSGSLDEQVTHQDGTSVSKTYVFTGCGTATIDVIASTDPNTPIGSQGEVTFDSCD